jgi:PilZ domain/Flagellar protein YcgR
MMKIDFVFLLKAIKENQTIYIYRKSRNQASSLRFFSRFFHVDSREESIIIDLPYVDGYTHKHLEPGELVSVVFHDSGFRFHFESRVQDVTELEASQGSRIPVLKIQWPLDIVDGNRRSLFRAAVYLDTYIKVKYTIQKGELAPNNNQSKHPNSHAPVYEGVEALMIDISENGAAIKINREMNILVGDSLNLCFRLEQENQRTIQLAGTVRNIRQYHGSNVHICGIQFDTKHTTQFKKALRDVACYIMSLDREKVHFFSVNRVVSPNPFVQKIADHEVTKEVLDKLLQKKLGLNETEFLESLVYVMDIDDYKDPAEQLVKAIPASLKEHYIQQFNANHKVAYYILGEAIKENRFKILAGVIKNPFLPVELLTRIALHGTPRMLRLLVASQSKLIAYPDIMDVMEENPRLTPSIQTKIDQLKSSYLKSRRVKEISEKDVIDHISKFTAEEWASAEEVERTVMDDQSDQDWVTKKALSILQKINRMPLRERIRLAFSGTRAERLVLTKDPNIFIVMAVIDSPKVTKDEILKLAQNKKTPKAVIDKICDIKTWTRDYSIMLTLLRHPQIPIIKAPGFILRLQLGDLNQLIMDKTIHPVVRNLADYFYGKRKADQANDSET